jgi:hypothetical protein
MGRRAAVIAKRGVGIVLGASPIALGVASLLASPQPASRLGFGLIALSAVIATVNVHASWVRPWLFRRRIGSYEGYRAVSGLPLLGTALGVGAMASAFGHAPIAVAAILLTLVDTGGPLWFLIATWHDASLWSGSDA